jgi:prefoldin subunit 5
MANYYANCLVSKGIYTSGQKNKLVNKLVSLSSGINVESTVLELLEESKKNSLFMNKPRTVIVKGTLDMSLTKDQRWMAFENAHKHQFMREELLHEFEKAESKLNSVSLSSGEGTIEDPSSTVGELCNKLQKMKEQGLLNDEHKMMLGKTLGDERLASFSDGKGDGKPVESGGTEMPNNTSLSDNVEPTPEADNHLRMLEKGFQAMEDENKKLKEEIEEHKKRHEHLKSILGETK